MDRILDLDRQNRALTQEIEDIAAQKNAASKEIANAQDPERQARILEMRDFTEREKSLRDRRTPIEEELQELLYKIPNPSLPDVKVGKSDTENEVVRYVGEKRVFDFEPKDHEDLGVALGIIDKERAAKVSGARFMYLKGKGVLLQMALVRFAFDKLEEHGFEPTIVPHMVSARAMRAMGYLEHGGHDEIYYLPKDNMYLIGTAEQALGPIHMDEILTSEELPKRYVGYSPCYRREAGTYGKDTKGILRVHQFDKIEMFSFVKPEDGDREHELILSIEEDLMQELEIPYQLIKMVTGDLGLPAARKFDIEAWVPTQQMYRETHSCSTTTDFQARRLNTRYRDPNGGNSYVHTLNGTVFAIGRTIAALMENHQQADGSIRIPAALVPYFGSDILS
jgi:seryl-tRNA synthetase